MARSAPDRIGIFGGSFNPVHRGHLALAQHARQELGLRKVIFVPSYHTPLKRSEDLLSAPLRWRCLQAAIRSHRGFEASRYEISRRRMVFTVETLAHFRRRFGRSCQLYFLVGADSARHLSRWKSPDKVLQLCRFVVCSRPGYRTVKARPGMVFLPFPALDISSSEVRRRLASGGRLKGLVDPSVERILSRRQRKVRRVPSKTRRRSP